MLTPINRSSSPRSTPGTRAHPRRATYECGRAHIKIGRDPGGRIRRMLRALKMRR